KSPDLSGLLRCRVSRMPEGGMGSIFDAAQYLTDQSSLSRLRQPVQWLIESQPSPKKISDDSLVPVGRFLI
ncbi:hypothetical protein, partial [Pseudomonas syringae]|uniref:hypothetical protein n=1 Tax=Pseudomonas syringae TaxID=317 RepID=UPI001F3823F1